VEEERHSKEVSTTKSDGRAAALPSVASLPMKDDAPQEANQQPVVTAGKAAAPKKSPPPAKPQSSQATGATSVPARKNGARPLVTKKSPLPASRRVAVRDQHEDPAAKASETRKPSAVVGLNNGESKRSPDENEPQNTRKRATTGSGSPPKKQCPSTEPAPVRRAARVQPALARGTPDDAIDLCSDSDSD